MTELGLRILEHLGYGKEHAVTAARLAFALGIPDRQLREEIRNLIAEGWAIASSVSKEKGYFIANCQAEVDEYIESVRGRLIEAYRIRDFKRAARVIRQARQIPLLVKGG